MKDMKKFFGALGKAGKSVGKAVWNGTFLDAALAVTVAATLCFAGGMMSGRVMNSPKYRVNLQTVTFSLSDRTLNARYPWIERSIRADLGRFAKERGGAPVFDTGMLRDLSELLSRNPWVESVVKTGPKYPRGVDIALKVRIPAAAVEVGMRYILVDSNLRRLPVTFASPPPDALKLVVLSARDRKINPPPIGSVFDEEVLFKAASMRQRAMEISSILKHTGDWITMIETSPCGNDPAGEINFMTSGGAMLEWGRPAGGAYFEPASPADKIAKLKYILSRDGALEQGWIYRLWTPMPAAETPDGSNE
jgi:hypothetical protein